ncbi:MAG: hypothetical protein K940chlam9_01488 [Chlamydiae bacterium]|nr:hypothetical protein [Chlamydiota bacterium]
MDIAVTILVKNGERKLREVLSSLANFKEVLLYDTGSTDQTLEIGKSFSNVTIVERLFTGFGPDHNKAASLAKHDWILSLDSDEVLSVALAEEILSLSLDPTCVYSLPFENYYRGKKIRYCGWYPERHVRLYNKKTTQFDNAYLHERIQTGNLKEVALKKPLYHYSYDSISDFLVKMERYSSLFAQQYKGKRQASPWTAWIHGMGAFCKSYFLKKGFLGGYEGFLISSYNAHTAFYKYLKLYEANLLEKK